MGESCDKKFRDHKKGQGKGFHRHANLAAEAYEEEEDEEDDEEDDAAAYFGGAGDEDEEHEMETKDEAEMDTFTCLLCLGVEEDHIPPLVQTETHAFLAWDRFNKG
eukprot:10595483-Karenia_brevis.AAC.1